MVVRLSTVIKMITITGTEKLILLDRARGANRQGGFKQLPFLDFMQSFATGMKDCQVTEYARLEVMRGVLQPIAYVHAVISVLPSATKFLALVERTFAIEPENPSYPHIIGGFGFSSESSSFLAYNEKSNRHDLLLTIARMLKSGEGLKLEWIGCDPFCMGY